VRGAELRGSGPRIALNSLGAGPGAGGGPAPGRASPASVRYQRVHQPSAPQLIGGVSSSRTQARSTTPYDLDRVTGSRYVSMLSRPRISSSVCDATSLPSLNSPCWLNEYP
jgi:hypothetical protein